MAVVVDYEIDEVLALRNLLHVACQARGMEVAATCVELDKKLLAAAIAFEKARGATQHAETA